MKRMPVIFHARCCGVVPFQNKERRKERCKCCTERKNLTLNKRENSGQGQGPFRQFSPFLIPSQNQPLFHSTSQFSNTFRMSKIGLSIGFEVTFGNNGDNCQCHQNCHKEPVFKTRRTKTLIDSK